MDINQKQVSELIHFLQEVEKSGLNFRIQSLEYQPKMSVEQFNHIIESRCEKIRNVLEKKAEEYARGDRLSNFRVAAHYLGQSSEQALLGMIVKHFVALRDFVMDLEQDRLQSYERWDEKITDMINYLILLEAFIFERHQIEKGEINDKISNTGGSFTLNSDSNKNNS